MGCPHSTSQHQKDIKEITKKRTKNNLLRELNTKLLGPYIVEEKLRNTQFGKIYGVRHHDRNVIINHIYK